jgi:hypothetical protein
VIAILVAAVAGALTGGVVLGHSAAIARRTYRDARATTRAARALWRQFPRDIAHVVRVGAVIVALAAVAVMGYRAGR